jgi:hypothetical protein
MNLLLEHKSAPGTVYSECLLFDGGYGVLNEMDLHESTDSEGGKLVRFRGKFQEADAINKNKRMYPFDVLDANVKRLQEAIKEGGLLGECDHPADSIIHFCNCSHLVKKLWWDGTTLMGEGVILNTPMGKLLRNLINDGVRIGISSRGVGNGKVNEDGILVIGESYKLITFDAVADPSTYAAFQEKVVDTRRESVISQNFAGSSVKNETQGIDNISEALILACVTGLIKEETNKIKARLNS